MSGVSSRVGGTTHWKAESNEITPRVSRGWRSPAASMAASRAMAILDAPPLLGVGDAVALSAHMDALLIVTRVATVNRSILGEMRRVLDTIPIRKLGFVTTDAEAERGYGTGYGYGYGYGYGNGHGNDSYYTSDGTTPQSNGNGTTAAAARNGAHSKAANGITPLRHPRRRSKSKQGWFSWLFTR